MENSVHGENSAIGDQAASGGDSFYEDVSDGEMSIPEEEPAAENVNNSDGSYAARMARGFPHIDANGSDNEDHFTRQYACGPGNQYRYLSDFEREHFHPLNVTPDRPCSAFFKADSNITAKEIFDAFIKDGISASAARCLQRKPSGKVMVTFTNPEHCFRFLDRSSFIMRRSKYSTHPASGPLTYVTVYDAPYELPDTAIIKRLSPYCKVFSCRRGKLQGYPDVYNGLRHFRVL